jgi:hypothetical protein
MEPSTSTFCKAHQEPLPLEALSYRKKHVEAGDMRSISQFGEGGLEMSPRSRLAYRPQPPLTVITENQRGWLLATSYIAKVGAIMSTSPLLINVASCVDAGLLELKSEQDSQVLYHKQDQDNGHSITALISLNSVATLPFLATSPRMIEWASMVSRLTQEFYRVQGSLWPQ